MKPQISIILSTIQPSWLEKALQGYNQTFKDFEILIADDGSKMKPGY